METRVVLTVALFLGSLCVVEAQVNPSRTDNAVAALARSMDEQQTFVDGFLAGMKRDAQIMSEINAAIEELRPRPDREQAIARAMAHLDEASHVTSGEPIAADAIRERIDRGIDTLRTAKMNAATTDLLKLGDELHHALVEPAVDMNFWQISRARELIMESMAAGASLESMAMQLNGLRTLFDSERFASQLPRSAIPGRALQPSINEFYMTVREFVERARVEHAVLSGSRSALDDLNTFQNAIGLDKALNRMKEAEGVSRTVAIDADLRKAVLLTTDRLNSALLSPSSTDMAALREELHHRLLHRATLVEEGNVVMSSVLVQAALTAATRLQGTAGSLSAAVQASAKSVVPALRPDP